MSAALRLGARMLGRTAPNPAVGCVIVKDNRIVGRGATAPGGRPHAETQALGQAGAAAKGATAYVTLEPCSHHGATPPCAQALVDAGIGRVVIAATDPNPQVHGQGITMLKSAGVDVTSGVLGHRAALDHAGFFQVHRVGRPWLTLKLASSLDGRIATQTGDSKWITGPISRRMVHMQRARHDAVMVGGGTVRSDDPSLTVRDVGITHQPARVVLSQNLDLPLNCKLAQTAQDIPLFLVHAKGADANLVAAWEGIGARLVEVPMGASPGLDVTAAMTQLAQKGLTRIYCEGGGAMAASLFRADLVDEYCHFQAGKLLGSESFPMVGTLGLTQLAKAPKLDFVAQRRVGTDVMSVWRRPGFSCGERT